MSTTDPMQGDRNKAITDGAGDYIAGKGKENYVLEDED